jgi:hypothetical protein
VSSNKSSQHLSDSDTESDEEALWKIDNNMYKRVPGNPKKKFDWASLGKKGQDFLDRFYKGNTGPPDSAI